MKLAISGVETIGELIELDNLEELSDESTIPVKRPQEYTAPSEID